MHTGHLLTGPGAPPAVTAWHRDTPTALHTPPDGSAMDTSTAEPIGSPPADPTTEDWLKRLRWKQGNAKVARGRSRQGQLCAGWWPSLGQVHAG